MLSVLVESLTTEAELHAQAAGIATAGKLY